MENGSHERVWLLHRGGFCAAFRVPQPPQQNGGGESRKVLIELEHNGEQIYVEDDDIEKANPDQFDFVEDICDLKHLNEASVLHIIRQRYASNLIHTKAGPTLLVINPMVSLSLYSEKVRSENFEILFNLTKENISNRLFPCSKDAKSRTCLHTFILLHKRHIGRCWKLDATKV